MNCAFALALSLLLRYSPLPLPTPEEALEPTTQAAQMDDRALEQRALSIFSGDPDAAPCWWLEGAAALNQTWGDGPDLPEEEPRWGGYYLIQRFPTLERLQQATEQQLTADYAQLFYDHAADFELFREVEGRLYGADAPQSLAVGKASWALVLRRGRDWALLLLRFEGVEGYYGAPVLLRLEEGQWKAHSSPYDKFLQPKRDDVGPFWPWTVYHAS